MHRFRAFSIGKIKWIVLRFRPRAVANVMLELLACHQNPHPIVISVEDALQRLKHLDDMPTSTFGSISSGLARPKDLHGLDMASTQQALRQHDQNTNAQLDSSVLRLDVCGVARDIVSQVKEYVHILQSSIRRRKGESILSSLRDDVNFINNARKYAKRLISAMKRVKRQVDVASGLDQDLETLAMMEVLRVVDELSTARFQTILCSFLNPPSRNKQSRLSSISRFVHEGKVASEEKPENLDELESIDAALYAQRKCSLDDAKTTEIQLQQVEDNMNGIALALESMFRQLVRSRACLLNILSQ